VNAPEAPEVKPARKASLPRWAVLALAPFVWLIAIPLVHGVVPYAISLLGPRYGWTDGSYAAWNLLGLVPVAAGAGVLLWVMVSGFAHAAEVPKRVDLDWTPKLLLTRGAYSFSRHPIYLAELALWLGWAVLYGSVIVLVGFLLLCLVAGVLAPREERALEAKFGDTYREYKSGVPRWFGLTRRRIERG
jgi:protein-S-isoprenylcysteine O-methyltransferase Ste14